jgi:L-rhamnose mutarotase
MIKVCHIQNYSIYLRSWTALITCFPISNTI